MSTLRNRKKPKSVAATFGEHVKELRTRTFVVAIVFFVLSLVAYAQRDPLVKVVLSPIGNQKLVYLTPAGGFGFIFSVTMYAALVVTVPFLLYQLYQFVKPTLPEKAKRYSLQIFLAAMVLMSAGVLFGYYVAVPSALQFLTTFAGDFVSPNLTAESYLSFFLAYVAGLGLLFQLPLLLLFWNWISPIKPGGLWNSQRFVIAGSFIVAAMITPTPDVFNQTLVAGPIIGIYQLGVIVVLLMNRKERKSFRKAARAEESRRASAAAVKPAPKPAMVPHIPVSAIVPRQAKKMPPLKPVVHHARPRPAQALKPVPLPRPIVVPAARQFRSIDGVSSMRQRTPTFQ